MSTFSERFRQEGMQQGIRQGMQQGVQQGMHKGVQQGEALMLMRLIEQKFGQQPETFHRKVKHADVETLNQWSARLFEARTVEDLLH